MQTRDYLERIGFEGGVVSDIDTLKQLHFAHLHSVPFENLDIARGVEISLDLNRIFRKVVGSRRGGFCYELNGLFGWLLSELSFDVEMLSARVFGGDGKPGPDFDHMLLRVNRDFIVDVGFGDSFIEPMRFNDTEQIQPNGKFRFTRHEDVFQIEREIEGLWKPQYLFTETPRSLRDYEEMCRFQQTSPDSIFTQKSICSVAKPFGRITISNDKFIETVDGVVSERVIESESERRDLLRERFGIRLTEI